MSIIKHQKLTGEAADLFHLTIATAWNHGDFFGILDDAGKSKWAADSAKNYCEVVGVECNDDMIAACREAWEFGAKYGSHDTLGAVDSVKAEEDNLWAALKDAGYSDFNAADTMRQIFEQVDIEMKRHEDPAFQEKQGKMFDTSKCTFVDARDGEWKEVSEEEFLAA